ncbi:uncharacterized protein RMCB_3708 [Mycolicibacterium brisbanense]|uniref:Uncharacterized protein n=1 Tax=Mycolicibacterium brisbanense TaxID=146020 RepID=A0A117I669_9MYCO|nr:uncharacterized protein RMCB_3708 [Mycolicibacterium brisbanense]
MGGHCQRKAGGGDDAHGRQEGTCGHNSAPQLSRRTLAAPHSLGKQWFTRVTGTTRFDKNLHTMRFLCHFRDVDMLIGTRDEMVTTDSGNTLCGSAVVLDGAVARTIERTH